MALHHVIVGSGIAGICAVETIRQRDPAAAITMVSEEPHKFYSRPGLAYYLRGDVSEKQLFIRTPEDLAAMKTTRVDARVDNIVGQELELSTGKKLGFDRLLLATGALAVPPSFPGSDLSGIVKLDGLDDTRQILKLARRGKPAVVVGGGITALELAEGLCARGMKVTYFLRGDRYWGDVLDEAESHIVMERLRHEGIVIRTNTQIKQAIGKGGTLTAVETQAGETFPCQVLANAIGVRPRTDLARKAGLKVDKGIFVDPYLRTSQENVFAAGDCAQVGSTPLDVLWPTAIDQGRVAGANMAGDSLAYVKGLACNVTMLSGLKVSIIGNVGRKKKDDKPDAKKQDEDLVTISRGDSEAWRLFPATAGVASNADDVNRVRLFVGEDSIVGALVMGDQTWSRPLQRLIGAKVDISPIRSALMSDAGEGLKRLAVLYQEWQEGTGKSSPSLHRVRNPLH
jgi:NADPH-dependent 2,4-dienoyl-CoA reductase/sulfur reductase-like enzyme